MKTRISVVIDDADNGRVNINVVKSGVNTIPKKYQGFIGTLFFAVSQVVADMVRLAEKKEAEQNGEVGK
ncbi:MAG: hypothetical protein IIZ94_04550 [Prevotella sp.]|nr:hypothetical protein [Prevotella sp.]